jgi:hypothetical protein
MIEIMVNKDEQIGLMPKWRHMKKALLHRAFVFVLLVKPNHVAAASAS